MPATSRVIGGKCAVFEIRQEYGFRLVMPRITAGFHPGRFTYQYRIFAII